MKFKKYKFKPYNKEYPRLYQKEKTKLIKILSKTAKIEHIGSTSVPGLGGKGIIDIIIAVPKKDILKIRRRLQDIGYTFKEKAGSKKRLFFERDYMHNKNIRRVHLQLTFINSSIWKKSIAVRDYLTANRKEAEKYAKIKKQATKIAKGEGKKYRKYKEGYLKDLERKTLK